MKKFTFRFERILHIRMLEEEQVQQEFNVVKSKLNLLLGEKHSLEQTLLALQEEMRQLMVGGAMDITKMLNYRSQTSGFELRLHKKMEEITLQQEVVSKVQDRLSAAMKERKMYEKIREKDQLVWKKAYNDHDNLILDEIGARKAKEQE
jgi:flagellar export protein FliJ